MILAVVGAALLCFPLAALADTTVTVDPGATWIGYMNVFDLPADGGAFQFASSWGTADLTATFSGPVLSLGACPIPTSDSFWYVGGVGGPGVPGNKSMDANMYVEVGDTLSGQTVTFEGIVLSNSLVDPYTSVAFIKDFAPDFSSFNVATAPLTPGTFSVSLAADPGAGRHVQYGFETVGPNVWPGDEAGKGYAQVTAIPEPASVLLMGIAALVGVGVIRSRRR